MRRIAGFFPLVPILPMPPHLRHRRKGSMRRIVAKMPEFLFAFVLTVLAVMRTLTQQRTCALTS